MAKVRCSQQGLGKTNIAPLIIRILLSEKCFKSIYNRMCTKGHECNNISLLAL